MSSIAERLETATEIAESASDIMRRVANDPEGAMIPTASGSVPSIAEWYKQNDMALQVIPMLAAQIAAIMSSETGQGANLIPYKPDQSVKEALDEIIKTSGPNLMRDYGAAGVGGDDTAAFQAANADLVSGAIRSLYIPAGSYINNSQLTPRRDGIVITGDGIGATTIIRTDGTFGDWINVAAANPATTQIRDFTIRDLTLYAAVDVESGASLRMRNVHRAQVHDIFLRNYHIGIHTEGIRDSTIAGTQMASNEFHTVARAGSCHFFFDKPTDPTKKSTETNITGFNWTTAGHANDVQHSLIINGDMDGVWWNDGHWFGGSLSGLMIDGDGVADLSSPIFNNVWMDQFTPINVIIKGVATDNFRFISFNDCRMWGGTSLIMDVYAGSNVADITINGGSVGVSQGQGIRCQSGALICKGVQFQALNQSGAANGYAINLPSSGAATRLEADDCTIDLSGKNAAGATVAGLTYGIFCQRTAAEYILGDNVFRNPGSSIIAEISHSGGTLVGRAANNVTTRDAAGTIAAAATISFANLAVDLLRLTGATVNIATLNIAAWHGRKITLHPASAQNIVNTGNIRNKNGDATRAVAANDMITYVYSAITGIWNEI